MAYEFDNTCTYEMYHKMNDGKYGWKTVSIDDINAIRMDNISNSIPATNGYYTTVNNYILRFWRPILKPSASSVLLTLMMYTFGQDKVFPSIPRICAESGLKPTATKEALKLLQEYGWIVRIQVLNQDGTNNNNLYLVKNLIPYIPVGEYEKFDEFMRNEHDRYLANLVEKHIVIQEGIPDYSSVPPIPKKEKKKKKKKVVDKPVDNTVDEMLTNVDNVDNVDENIEESLNDGSKKEGSLNDTPTNYDEIGVVKRGVSENDGYGVVKRGVTGRQTTTNNNDFKNNDFNKEKDNNTFIYNRYDKKYSLEQVNDYLHSALIESLSKPSYETWFTSNGIQTTLVTDISHSTVYLVASNDFAREWIQNRYTERIMAILRELAFNCEDVKVYVR